MCVFLEFQLLCKLSILRLFLVYFCVLVSLRIVRSIYCFVTLVELSRGSFISWCQYSRIWLFYTGTNVFYWTNCFRCFYYLWIFVHFIKIGEQQPKQQKSFNECWELLEFIKQWLAKRSYALHIRSLCPTISDKILEKRRQNNTAAAATVTATAVAADEENEEKQNKNEQTSNAHEQWTVWLMRVQRIYAWVTVKHGAQQIE